MRTSACLRIVRMFRHGPLAAVQYLLALDPYAARVDRDARDIRLLAGECGLETAEEVLDLAEQYLAGIPIPAEV